MAVIVLPATTTTIPLGLRAPAGSFGGSSSNGAGCCSAIDRARGGLALATTGWEERRRRLQHDEQQQQARRRTTKIAAEVICFSRGENWERPARRGDGGERMDWGMASAARRAGAGSSAAEKWRVLASAEVEVASGGGDGGSGKGGFGDGGSGGGGDSSGDDYSSADDDESEGSGENRAASLAVLATVGKSLESLPVYLAKAVEQGKIPPAVLERFLDLEKTTFRKWLLQFGGFRERLLADDLFLTKVGIECGVGLFTKTAAEYERRRENFGKELDFVIADVIMALVADFMLVWLPAPTVSLRPALAKNANALAKYLANCPDNAFQIALRGTTYTVPQRLGAIVRNGAKLLVVGTSASLLGTAATNGLIKLRQKLDKKEVVVASVSEEVDVPILATSLAYGVYMAVSSNLRYQVLAGVVEQRVLEPVLGRRKFALGAASFAVRTGNTFLGSLLWVDYARWVGVQ